MRNKSDYYSKSLCRSKPRGIEGERKCLITNLEEISATNGSHGAYHVQKKLRFISELIKRSQDVEVYDVDYVILSDREKYEEYVGDCEQDRDKYIIAGDVQSTYARS